MSGNDDLFGNHNADPTTTIQRLREELASKDQREKELLKQIKELEMLVESMRLTQEKLSIDNATLLEAIQKQSEQLSQLQQVLPEIVEKSDRGRSLGDLMQSWKATTTAISKSVINLANVAPQGHQTNPLDNFIRPITPAELLLSFAELHALACPLNSVPSADVAQSFVEKQDTDQSNPHTEIMSNINMLKSKTSKTFHWMKKQAKTAIGQEFSVVIQGRSYRVLKHIADGTNSTVYYCKDEAKGTKFALKKAQVNSKELLAAFQNQINIAQKIKHPNIVSISLSDTIDRTGVREIAILMEYGEKTLANLVAERSEQGRSLSENDILRVTTDIIGALSFLHGMNTPLSHRAITAENVVLVDSKVFKICHFKSITPYAIEPKSTKDLAAAEEELNNYTVAPYRAPEIWNLQVNKRVDEKVDIWSLGVLVFFMCYFQLPFGVSNKLQVINGQYTIPSLPPFNAKVTQVIKDCLIVDPASRPDIWSVAEKVAQARGSQNPFARPSKVATQQVNPRFQSTSPQETIVKSPVRSAPTPSNPISPKPPASPTKPIPTTTTVTKPATLSPIQPTDTSKPYVEEDLFAAFPPTASSTTVTPTTLTPSSTSTQAKDEIDLFSSAPSTSGNPIVAPVTSNSQTTKATPADDLFNFF